MLNTNIHEAVLAYLEDAKGQWPAVAEDVGMSRRTLEKIARQEIPNPGVHHVQRLYDYFVAKQRKPNKGRAA